MCRAVLVFFCALLVSPSFAQRITLHSLMRFHSLDDSAISGQLHEEGWRYMGVQYNVPRKPRMFENVSLPYTHLYLYNYHRKPLCKVELVYGDVESFNANIRDSLSYYGFQPETDRDAPDEQSLKITSSAYFINTDAGIPVHALILYFEEHHRHMVSLTIYDDE